MIISIFIYFLLKQAFLIVPGKNLKTCRLTSLHCNVMNTIMLSCSGSHMSLVMVGECLTVRAVEVGIEIY